MIEINGKQLCENCFEEITSQPCPHCGFETSAPCADPTILAPGSILLGKYIIGKTIGKGGFGITYLAYDTTVGKKVAIKEFYPYGIALRTAGNPTVSVSTSENASVFKNGAERFYDEAKLVSRFNGNPNIVAVHEFFYENDTVYFAMEYLSGITLKDYIQKSGTLTPGQALFIAQNVSSALMVAHSASVLHRDISPDNIMLCSNGEVKIIDFGAARQVIAERSQTFSVILKPGFAPLEQYQKKGKQGPWTDIYSLGATLYYALTGQIPDDPMSRQEEDDTFAENNFGINEELWDIIVKATMLRIPDRYQDTFELRKDLDRVSFVAELIVSPTIGESAPRETFRTAMPFGASAATVTPTVAEQTAAVSVSTANAVAEQKSLGFFAKYKKPLIAAIGGTATVAAAAVIIAVALNLVGKQSPDIKLQNPDYSQNSFVPIDDSDHSSLTQTTTTATTTQADEKPVESEPEIDSKLEVDSKPEVESKPEVDFEPEVTTPATTTTKTTPKPEESKPEEIKSVIIGGESYSTDLTELSLEIKGLTDNDVKNLKYMKNLTQLRLYDNKITDISFVKEMPNLQHLDISNNNVSDISAVKNTPNLKRLIFSNNNVSDVSAVKNLTKLMSISGESNPVSDISVLKNLKSLTYVNFCDTKVTDISPIAGCTTLKSVWFDNCSIGDSLCALKDLSDLETVYLDNCGIYDLSPLAGKKKLSSINLNDNMISDVSPLKDCENISYLYLSRNRISATGIDFFDGLKVNGPLWLNGNGLTRDQANIILQKINGSPQIKY